MTNDENEKLIEKVTLNSADSPEPVETVESVDEDVEHVSFDGMPLKFEMLVKSAVRKLGLKIDSNVKGLFAQYSQQMSRVNDRFSQGVLDKTNALVKRLDKKFTDLHGFLVNQTLTGIDRAVYNLELRHRAMEDIITHEVVDLKCKINNIPDDKSPAMFVALKKEMDERMKEVHKEVQEKEKEKLKGEKDGEKKDQVEQGEGHQGDSEEEKQPGDSKAPDSKQ